MRNIDVMELRRARKAIGRLLSDEDLMRQEVSIVSNILIKHKVMVKNEDGRFAIARDLVKAIYAKRD